MIQMPLGSGASYGLYTRVYLNPLSKEYETILVLDRHPMENTELRELLKPIRLPPLSPFKPRSKISCGSGTMVYAIRSLRWENGKQQSWRLMSPDELPLLVSFLASNGYIINTELTKMIQSGPIGNMIAKDDSGGEQSGSLVCYLQYMPIAEKYEMEDRRREREMRLLENKCSADAAARADTGTDKS